MHISVTLPANASSSSASPPRVVAVDKVVIILSRRTLTRGGRDERPHFSLVELRREEIKLWDDDAAQPLERMATMAPLSSRTSIKNGEIENGRPHLRLEAGGKGKDIRLDVPLQTVSMTPQGKQTVPARDFRLSMRTPNIESEVSSAAPLALSLTDEYHMRCTVRPLGHGTARQSTFFLCCSCTDTVHRRRLDGSASFRSCFGSAHRPGACSGCSRTGRSACIHVDCSCSVLKVLLSL